jgi:hypothetical protein
MVLFHNILKISSNKTISVITPHFEGVLLNMYLSSVGTVKPRNLILRPQNYKVSYLMVTVDCLIPGFGIVYKRTRSNDRGGRVPDFLVSLSCVRLKKDLSGLKNYTYTTCSKYGIRILIMLRYIKSCLTNKAIVEKS